MNSSPQDSNKEVTPHADDQIPGIGSRGSSKMTRKLFEWARIILVAGILAVGVRAYVARTFFIPSGSMLPTLQIGDRIMVDHLPFVIDNINRGDIVVFGRVPADNDPNHPADLVKRVVGLPGETISSRGDQILINGHVLSEPWLPNFNAQPAIGSCGQAAFDITKTKIAANSYFVMGDCRGNSLDSRAWGTVPKSYIVGKVFVVFWRNGHPFLHWF